MSKRLSTGVFIATAMLAGCAQTPTENSSSHSHHTASQAKASHALDAKGTTESLSQKEIVDQIMLESGLDEMIEQMPAMITSMSANQPPPPMIKIENYEKFKANLIQIFEPVKTRKIFKDYLDEHYDAKRYPEFLALLKTPLSQEMKALDLASQTPEAHQEMMETGDLLMREASPERLELVRQFDEATGATEMMVDMQMIIAGTIQRNMNKIMPPEHRMAEAQLEEMLEQGRMQSMLPARQYMQLSMIYSYRSVDDEKLNDYFDLHQSEIGLWGTELAKGSILKWAENMGEEMAAVMEKAFLETNQ